MFNLDIFQNLATILRSLGPRANVEYDSKEQSTQKRKGFY